MGFPKALLPCNDTFKALYLVRLLYKESIKTYLTLPQFLLNDRDLCRELSIYDPIITANVHEDLGFVGSIKTVLEVNPILPGLLIVPIDTNLCSSLITFLLNFIHHTNHQPALIAPCFYQTRGHPVYFSHHFFKELIHSHQHGGPRALFKSHKKYAHQLFWPDARILANTNHRHDYYGFRSNPALKLMPLDTPDTSS